MKGNNNKISSQFSTKLSNILNKFKDNATVQVGHEQLRLLFGQFVFKDIFNSFISKMDSSQQLNQRQKKQYGKVYITFVDSYKDQILFDQFFDKLMESLNKKQSGISQVIGHISKTILNRIQSPQNLYPYINIIINIFRHHFQIAKILKQVIDSTASILVAEIQQEIIGMIIQKVNSSKNKNQFLDAILSLVLCLEQNLTVENQVVNSVIKYLKNEDWNCRKMCVDISYAILVIKKEISSTIHSIIKELKYDKIKHVRDSVNNYQQLYKQLFGEQVVPKSNTVIGKRKQANSESQKRQQNKSPIQFTEKQSKPTRDKSNSIDKSAKKLKNENFFKNAKDSDVIRVHQENKSMIQIRSDLQQMKQSSLSLIPKEISFRLQEIKHKQQSKNFQTYLKDRASPKTKELKTPLVKSLSPKNKVIQPNRNEHMKRTQNQSRKQPKFNYENQFEQFKKKNRVNEVQLKKVDKQEEISSFIEQSFEKNRPQINFSQLSVKSQTNQILQIKNLFLEFSKTMFEKIDKLQRRIDNLEKGKVPVQVANRKLTSFQPLQIKQMYESQKMSLSESNRTSQNNQKQAYQSNHKIQSPRSQFFNESANESRWQNSDFQGIQSNLQQKIRVSMVNQNWDEAFTIALTNNKKNILLNLFQKCVFPRDKTVQECILLEIKKLLNYISTLKWLKYFLMEREMNFTRLQRLKEQLLRRGSSDNRNYQMMKQLLLNEIQQQLKKHNFQS